MEGLHYIGIDPGTKGGIAVIDTDGALTVWRLSKHPHKALVKALRQHKRAVTYIEQVHSMPGQGVASTFKFGQSYGRIIGWCEAVGLTLNYITPQRWQKYYKTPKLPKAKRKAWFKDKAKELFPNHTFTLEEADSVLIAHYAAQLHKKGT